MRIKLMMVRERRLRSAVLNSPQDTFEFMRKESQHLDREHFWRIDLCARNSVLALEVCSIGTLTASLVHPREVFKGALLNNAASIIVAHNHPSGNLNPSPEDKEATERLRRAGELMGVTLTDHLILTDKGFFSFRERGLL